MQNNKKSSDELNYKQAYLYLFNQTIDMVKRLIIMQRKAESICIDDTPPENIEIDVDEVLKYLIDTIKEKE